MLPLRLVIDTNVLISAALKPDGLQRAVPLLAITKPARLYVSRSILAEYRTVLVPPELRILKGLRQQLLQLIKNHSYTVVPTRHLEVTSDPDDNIFLECADTAGGLLSDGQSEALSEVLEENQGRYISRIH
jgi:uncharacterized protein